MAESFRRKLLDVPNSHNNPQWRRRERMLERQTHDFFVVHESAQLGTFMHGEAQIEQQDRDEWRKLAAPSKLLVRLQKQRKARAGVRMDRAAKRALRARRAQAKAMGHIVASQAKGERYDQPVVIG